MSLAEVELPSNRKFGFFFTLIFFILSVYFYYNANVFWLNIFSGLAVLFLLLTLIRANVLLPLNKLWMQFGLLLGMVISPIVLGVIFFGIFTPIAFLMRIAGRDELGLKFKKTSSHWILRKEQIQSDSFKRQF